MSEEKSPPPQGIDLSGILGALLSNPEALSRVGKIISDHVSTDETGKTDNPPPDSDNTEEINTNFSTNPDISTENKESTATSQLFELGNALPKLLSVLSSSGDAPSQKNKEQIALLSAIKPYLSPRRRNMIDSFIKVSRFGELFKNFNGGQNVL